MNTSTHRPLRLAILGFGGRAEGMVHVCQQEGLIPDTLRVVCVADPKPARQQRARELFGPDCQILEWGESLYDQDMEVDGVWVMSQERTHAQLAVPALERDIPVILEKPLATSIRDAYRICDAYERHPVPLVVPHSLRYLAAYRKVKELIEDGAVGQILHIHAVEQIDDQHTVGYYRRGPGMYRDNTTFLLAKCSHDIDIINWMMGGVRARSVASFGGADYFKPQADLPDRCSPRCPQATSCPFMTSGHQATVAVDADTTAVVEGGLCAWNSGAEQIDHQTLIIEFEDGTTADFTLNCFGDGRRPLQITGTDGTIYATPQDVQLVTYHPFHVEEFGADRLAVRAGSHGGADAALIHDWINAVRTGEAPHSASVHESAEAVAVCVGADLSLMRHAIMEMAALREERPGPEVLLWPASPATAGSLDR